MSDTEVRLEGNNVLRVVLNISCLFNDVVLSDLQYESKYPNVDFFACFINLGRKSDISLVLMFIHFIISDLLSLEVASEHPITTLYKKTVPILYLGTDHHHAVPNLAGKTRIVW